MSCSSLHSLSSLVSSEITFFHPINSYWTLVIDQSSTRWSGCHWCDSHLQNGHDDDVHQRETDTLMMVLPSNLSPKCWNFEEQINIRWPQMCPRAPQWHDYIYSRSPFTYINSKQKKQKCGVNDNITQSPTSWDYTLRISFLEIFFAVIAPNLLFDSPFQNPWHLTSHSLFKCCHSQNFPHP